MSRSRSRWPHTRRPGDRAAAHERYLRQLTASVDPAPAEPEPEEAPLGSDRIATQHGTQQIEDVGRKVAALRVSARPRRAGEVEVVCRADKRMPLHQRVRGILCNAAYCGYVSGKRDVSRTIKGLHEPIVSEELFVRVQEVRTWRARVLKAGPASEDYLLRKLLRCDRCRARMHGYPRRAQRHAPLHVLSGITPPRPAASR
jgi:hypothetical protein